MRYTFDNSEANGDNPSNPPVRVRLGPRSVDEMAELGLQLMPKSTADAALLAQSFDDRDTLASVALGEMRVRESPGSAADRQFLGGALRRGRPIRRRDSAPRGGDPPRPRSATATAIWHGAHGGGAPGRRAETPAARRRARAARRNILFNYGNALSKAVAGPPKPRRPTSGRWRSIRSFPTRTSTWERCSSRAAG